MLLENGIEENTQKELFAAFQQTKCYSCAYCADYKMKPEQFTDLDVRLSGAVKTFCHACSDVVPVLFDKNEFCSHEYNADNE